MACGPMCHVSSMASWKKAVILVDNYINMYSNYKNTHALPTAVLKLRKKGSTDCLFGMKIGIKSCCTLGVSGDNSP